jgi:thiamine-phosphate diphosphorylase
MVITDRRRLAEALAVPVGEVLPHLVAQLEGALRGGADLVYLREPDLDVRHIMGVVHQVTRRLPHCRHRIVVRDRADVAAALDVGVHLPEQGLTIDQARHVLRNPLAPVGRAVHTPDEAAASRDATYLVAGTVKATRSKPGLVQPLGWDGLRAICEAAASTPVLAVGGLGTEDIPVLKRSGARGLAAIGLFIPTRNCTNVTSWTIERLTCVRNCVDSVEQPT